MVVQNKILRDVIISISGGIIALLITDHLIQSLIVVIILLVLTVGVQKLKKWDMNKIGIEKVFLNKLHKEPDAISCLDRCSKRIKILTFSGLIWQTELNTRFEEIISTKRIGDVRVLILNPNSRYVEVRTKELNQRTEAMISDIVGARNRLLELKKQKLINVREYDDLPIFRLIFIDDTLFLGMYSKNKSVEDSVTYKIVNSSHSLFDIFDKYFEHIWNNRSKELE